MRQLPTQSACSVLTITPSGRHEYAWAADMQTAIEVLDPFSVCFYLRGRYVYPANEARMPPSLTGEG
jgi:hypothetical protein